MDRASRHARHESGGAWLADSLERFVDSETRGAARADALARARDDDDARVGVARDGDSGARVSTTSRDDASAIARERERARVLLDYFQHLERFDAWIAVSNLWERREHAGVSDYLCARLYRETSDEALERYLSQMVTMWVHAVENKTNERGSDAGHLASFERMMVMTSRRSLRLATKICWLLAAAAGDSAESKAVLDFRDECAREAVKNGTWPAPFEERVPMGGESAGTEAATATTERGGSPPRNGRTGAPAESTPEPVTPPRRIFGMAKSPGRRSSDGFDGKRVESPPAAGGFLAGVSRALSFRSSPSGSRKDSGKKNREHHKDKEKSPGKTKDAGLRSPSGGLSSLFGVCGTKGLPAEDGAKALNLRRKTFDATMKLTDDLCELSLKLSKVFPLENRQSILRRELAQMNKRFRHTDKGTGILFPMGHGEMERVIRIPWEEAVLLNSREKAPYLVCLEVVSSNPTQEEMHNATSSAESSGLPTVEDFYPVGDDFTINSRERIRRSLDKAYGDLPTIDGAGTDSFSTEDSLADELVNVVLTADEHSESVVMHVVATQGHMDIPQSPHQRKPSEIGLIEMAAQVNRTSWAPEKDAFDVTSLPTATGVGAALTSSPHKRSAGGLGELWADKRERIRHSSPYGNLPGWGLKPIIIKAGDNCRQELLALQLVRTFAEIYRTAGVRCWIRDFDILTTNTHSAVIEAVTDAPSVHALKSRSQRGTTLREHFERKFGVGTPEFRKAQNNFVESLAGYSILTYLLQVKDRHNGNILLHDDGHLIHIDFNFMLSTSPGGINFESSPFKLTKEYLEVMDSDVEGSRSDAFDAYKALCIQGYLAVREHAERIVLLVEMMGASGCPCFNAGPKVIKQLRRRFNLALSEEQCVETVLGMISDSIDAWSTRQYDFYQRILNGIL